MFHIRFVNILLVVMLVIFLGVAFALMLPWLANWQGSAAQSEPGEQLDLEARHAPSVSKRYYVAKTGDGSDPTSGWSTAYNDLQDALTAANSGDEIWVATGVYTPGINEANTFDLVPGVALNGGFAATETLLIERDWIKNVTILSGDIDGDDVTDTNGIVSDVDDIKGNNSDHVVTADGTTGIPIQNDTVLDGFIITAGQADGDAQPYIWGGGFYCNGSGSGNECSPNLSNVTFSGNFAEYNGGAMNNDGENGGTSSPSLANILFTGNSAENGGAMFNLGHFGGNSSPILTNVTFSGNSAKYNGGAMYISGSDGTNSPQLINVTFIRNSAKTGGAIANFASSYGGSSSPILINVNFSGNSAEENGGGMHNIAVDGGENNPFMTNITFSGNSAGENGGAIYNTGYGGVMLHDGSIKQDLSNSILWNNKDSSDIDSLAATIYNDPNKATAIKTITISFTNSLVQGTGGSGSWINGPSFVDNGGNIDTDPMFLTPVNPSSAPTSSGNLRLQSSSPAINAGQNDFVTVATDLDGNNRIIGCNVDMGAFETLGDFPCLVFEPLIFR